MSSAENSEAIEIPFAFRTQVGPRKHLLHIADRFEANTVLCSFNTIQPFSCVCIYIYCVCTHVAEIAFVISIAASVSLDG